MKTTRLLSLFLAISLICTVFTGCNQNLDEELVAKNNALARIGNQRITSDEESGIYLTDHLLYYVDTKNSTGAPVCGKPECTHDIENYNADCFAVRCGYSGDSIYYVNDHLYYDRQGKLYQNDGTGADEKELADFNKQMKKQVDAALQKDEKLRSNQVRIKVSGVYDGKLYVRAEVSLGRAVTASFIEQANVYVRALFTCDLKTGAVERCNDETLCALIEKRPRSIFIETLLCGDLLFIIRNTTEYELLPTSDDYFSQENWQDERMENPPYKESKGNIEYRAYSLAKKKVLKEWSVPDNDESRRFDAIRINADKTFLHVEQADGKYTYTEYNDNCEKIAEFTSEHSYWTIKNRNYYYFKLQDMENSEILRYNLKTKESVTLMTEGFMPCSAYDFYGITDKKILGTIKSKEYVFGLLDLSCFDTGKAEVQPVEGIAPLRRD